ncbi:MAG: GNAT family N-acetyltransferase [Oscillospiraceae bacterium]|nr:GNAT family N-acetyltransferase [Oscillospiraceae bacterium]
MLYLQPVSLTDGREFYDMLQSIGAKENGFLNSAHGIPYADFPAYLKRKVDMAQGIGLEDWMVPASTFWLMSDGVPVGQGNLRHRLTDTLREAGGHIGYAIASGHRGKGYGKELLRLMLEEARRMGIMEEILVTVYPDNILSRKVAEANGGELRRETEERAYYWFR